MQKVKSVTIVSNSEVEDGGFLVTTVSLMPDGSVHVDHSNELAGSTHKFPSVKAFRQYVEAGKLFLDKL